MQTNEQLACHLGEFTPGFFRLPGLRVGPESFGQRCRMGTGASGQRRQLGSIKEERPRFQLTSTMPLSGSSAEISELNDINSLEQLYRPRLLRYVALSVDDLDLAESITQDCIRKAFRRRDSFLGDCSVNTWLFGIANNLIRDQLRARKFQFWRKGQPIAVGLTDIALVAPSERRSPRNQSLTLERADLMQRALRELSANQRQVFLLQFMEEMNLEEISVVMGMPADIVKTHLHSAIAAIRTQFGGAR
jgi:RNA polymerase sigma-70 factor (ECF subfamily)